MLKLTKLGEPPNCCRSSPLGVMLLSYAALCRTDEDYCRFYLQDDEAVLLQNGASAVICADENADFDEIRRFVDFLGCQTILSDHGGMADQKIVLTGNGVMMTGFFEKDEEPVLSPQTTADYRAVYDLLRLPDVCFESWFADVNLRIRRGTAQVAVAVENGRIVATASALHQTPDSRIIGAVATKEEYRGRGFASALVKQLSAKTSYLLCLPEWEGFYQRLGFRTCGQWYEYERIEETQQYDEPVFSIG